jgi:large subunit ribosomal protein L29
MELTKIRSLGDEELAHQEKTSSEQLFRLRFQVSMGQNDGVKKLRQLRREIAQIKTVARERELGIHGETNETKQAAPVVEAKAAEVKAAEVKEAAPVAEKKAAKSKKGAPAAASKTAKAKGAGK